MTITNVARQGIPVFKLLYDDDDDLMIGLFVDLVDMY